VDIGLSQRHYSLHRRCFHSEHNPQDSPLAARTGRWTNLFCFLAHTTMVIMTLHYAYWRWDRNMFTDTEHVTVYIHRVTQVPTPAMIANNETRWSPGWNLTNSRDSGGNEWYVRDNGMPINFATLTLSFFAVSALFHLWACVVGLFERFWFFYWRQMDDAFCYWRWLEYSVSASIMASKSSELNHTPSTHCYRQHSSLLQNSLA
tara:strand:+ start:58 stop:669 length:612 start_codon:yes stop_codon:yes gene_type:complete